MADLYDSRKDGWYWYTYGFNFRAYAAYIAGIIINVVGFAGASAYLSFCVVYSFRLTGDRPIAGRTVPLAATRIYQMSFFTGFGVSAIIYFLLNVVFPVPGKFSKFEEIDVSEGEEKSDGSSSEQEEDLDVKKGDHVEEIYAV